MKLKNEDRAILYAEPSGYIPEEIRKRYKLGEYAESEGLRMLKALMLGHAVADALGVPAEFSSREKLAKHPVTDMVGFGAHKVPEGCWSDDTSMSLATLDSLIADRIDYNDIMDKFSAWFRSSEYTPTGVLFDIGNTCMRAIMKYLKSDEKNALACGLSDEYSNGNGSLMRIHPMAMYVYLKCMDDKEAIDVINKTSAITHANPRSKMACGIYFFVFRELMREQSKASVIKGLEYAREFYYGMTDEDNYEDFLIYDRMLFKRIGHIYDAACDDGHEVRQEVSESEIRSSGYVVDTLEAAIWCILTTYSYKECVLKAVNLGRDTDTVAAIAGGLAATLYGIDSIPEPWLDKLKRRDYIEKMCEAAYAEWTV